MAISKQPTVVSVESAFDRFRCLPITSDAVLSPWKTSIWAHYGTYIMSETCNKVQLGWVELDNNTGYLVKHLYLIIKEISWNRWIKLVVIVNWDDTQDLKPETQVAPRTNKRVCMFREFCYYMFVNKERYLLWSLI